jgi:hypothetical protein
MTVQMDDASWLLRQIAKIFGPDASNPIMPIRVSLRMERLFFITHNAQSYEAGDRMRKFFDQIELSGSFGAPIVEIAREENSYMGAGALRVAFSIYIKESPVLRRAIADYIRHHVTFTEDEAANWMDAGVPLAVFVTEFLTPVSWGMKVIG